jgi:hypothetical protein
MSKTNADSIAQEVYARFDAKLAELGAAMDGKLAVGTS